MIDAMLWEIPASIAVVLPRHLSGIFLKPLRVWDYPNNLPFVPKRRCLLVHSRYIFFFGKYKPKKQRPRGGTTLLGTQQNPAETGFYYVSSRYYDPEIGRFINADAFPSTGQGIIGNNMFAYCGNNPVARVDIGGYFWDTVFDVVSLCFSIVDVASNPTDVTAWIGLAGDAIDLIPFVSGVGELTRAATTTLEVIDSVHDASRVIDNTGDIIDTAANVQPRNSHRRSRLPQYLLFGTLFMITYAKELMASTWR